MGADLIYAALDEVDTRWFGELGATLAGIRWAAVKSSIGLDRTTYGTGRYLARNAGAPRHDQTAIYLPVAFHANAPVIVEILFGPASSRYKHLGLNFHAPAEIDPGNIRSRLDEAFLRIGDVSGAATAVGAVLAVIHVVKPTGPDYDVSYSDPELPFSIFVGIDARGDTHCDLRLAESILHECMHLQLTLIEETVPLVAGSEERHHSPWQRTLRPSQGVLHGLYVFRVIQDFHRTLLDGGFCTKDERIYLNRRISVIEEEVAAAADFRNSRELTPAGRRFVSALLTS